MRKQLDQVFEAIMTGMEMIDAVVEEYGRLNPPQGKDDPKSDHPSSMFEESLRDQDQQQSKRDQS